MAQRAFFDLFSKLDPSKYDPKVCSAMVSDIRIQREKRVLVGSVVFDNYLSQNEISSLLDDVRSVYALSELRLKVSFQGEFFSEDKWQDIVTVIRQKNVNCNGFFNDSTVSVSEDVVTVELRHGGLSILEKFHLDRDVAAAIEERFGKRYQVVFSGVTEATVDRNEIASLEIPRFEAPSRPVPVTPPERPVTKYNHRREKPDPSITLSGKDLAFDLTDIELLKGKKTGDAVIRISELNADFSRATIVGEIFYFDSRPTWDKRNVRVTIYITDDTGSFVVKFMDKAENFDEYADKLKIGHSVLVTGDVMYDKYESDNVLQASAVASVRRRKAIDPYPEKRVELHLHTKMSTMDATNDIEEFVKRASEWGHKAIAVTDHGNVQAFPQAQAAGDEYGVKIIYGMEGYLINDMTNAVVFGDGKADFKDTYVIFDLETTGLSAAENRVTEIGAVKMKDGEIIDTFQTFVDPETSIPAKIVELTGITDEMVKDAPTFAEAFENFAAFCGNNAVLVAHNANFDVGFMRAGAERIGKTFDYTYIDTVPVCRYVFPDMRSVKLDLVASRIRLPKFDHHRAVDDAKTLAGIVQYLFDFLQSHDKITSLDDMREYINKVDYKSKNTRYSHVVLLAKNKVGLKNLYKLISKSSIEHFYKKPLIFKSELAALREGLIIGSACEAGELYRAVVNGKTEEELLSLADFYDYLEIQPLGNNMYLFRNGTVGSIESLKDFNRKIIKLGEKLGKPVCATCDAHFLNKNDEVFRRILQAGQGYTDAEEQPPLYFRDTKAMLDEFDYLDPEKAHEIVIENPNKIADLCEPIVPIPDGIYPPVLEGCETELREIANRRAVEIYGDPVPDFITERMNKELDSIIGNGYAVMYMVAQKLVKKSNKDGYFVGSRGSVGSSFAAYIVGISEVNPLPPHYLCPKCKHIEVFNDGSVGSGFDLPDKNCPKCGTSMKGDGHDIPFETFLGFKGDKVPDIDLNFSGVYQPTAQAYVEDMFGKGYVFKAGTIGTVADRTAYGFVKKYLEAKELTLNKAEEQRLVNGCVGVKRTTGQHPAGMVVIPEKYEVYDFCPIQHPADDQTSGILTTHFDFNSMHDTIMKFDILGHDVPTLLKKLEDLTGVPFESIPMNDPDIYGLLQSPKALGVSPEAIRCETGTLALPEMGTSFVRGMLLQAKPKNFSDLLQISGLSHGTDVWLGNAADLIEKGICGISDVIGTRDSIMVYLIHKGMEPSLAFKIMEIVRKGKSKKLLTQEMIDEMKRVGCPEWYVESCMKIKYMFPKAHAAAYVMGAIRLGWYKIHYPLEFYAAHFSVRPDGFDALEVGKGAEYVKNVIASIENLGKEAKATDTDKATTYQVVVEAMARGIEFLPVDLERSDATQFLPEDGKIRMPFSVFSGVGEAAAKGIAAARDRGGYISQEEFRTMAGISNTIVELFDRENVFGGLPATSQITFF